MQQTVRRSRIIVLRPDFFLAFALLFYFDSAGFLILTFIFAIFHELGHVAAVVLCGGRVKSLELTCFGATMRQASYPVLSYRREMICTAAGSAANIFLALAFSCVGLYFYAGINAVLAFYNLLPASCLDGGRLIFLFFQSAGHEKAGHAAVFIMGICVCCGVSWLAIFLAISGNLNPAMLISCLFLCISVFRDDLM